MLISRAGCISSFDADGDVFQEASTAVKPVGCRAVRWRRTDRRRASYRRQSRGRRRRRHVESEFESAATGPGLLFHRVGAIVRTGAHSRYLSRLSHGIP